MNSMMILLLGGKNLFIRTKLEDTGYITWLELCLQDDLKLGYPLRIESYAMLGHSKYQNIWPKEQAQFKYRESSF